MRKMVTLFLLVCSVMVFAFANSAKAHVHLSKTQLEAVHKTVDQTGLNDLALDGSDDPGATEDGECFCKEKSKTTSFICGMVLAPASQFEHNLHLRAQKERFQFDQAEGVQSHISQLKRPPRTIL